MLCADQPLSIQVTRAKRRPRSASTRTPPVSSRAPPNATTDPNHKPELVFALTPFLAMNGFRELPISFPAATYRRRAPRYRRLPAAAGHRPSVYLFASLLTMSGEQKSLDTQRAESRAQQLAGATLGYRAGSSPVSIRTTAACSPLLLNVVQLTPGEAMFPVCRNAARLPEGVALEVMANSG